MLRGLAIRQAFIFVDLVLAALVGVVAYLVILKSFSPVDSDIAPPPPTRLGEAPQIPGTKPRSEYDLIARSGLFGPAAAAKSTDQPPLPPSGPEVPTDLPLRLIGTCAAFPSDPLGSAVVENTVSRQVDTFYLGQSIMPNVTLIEVHSKKVILNNETKKAREVLDMTTPKEAPAAGALAARLGGPTPIGPGASVIIPKDEVVQQFTENATELLTTASPEMYTDQNGKVAGITSRNLSKIPLAQKIGLRDNDVVQTVNGVAIDSEEKIPEIINRFGSLNVFRLGILRDGKPQVLTFRLQ